MTGNIAIIPARGGSKRIPRKNIKVFAGKPMIAYAIDAALGSGLFRHVVVSTDDLEIAAIARDFGALVPFQRPADLADDHTPTVPVVAHAIRACEMLGLAADNVCCIYPGVPFIEQSDLVLAHRMLAEGFSSYVFPVAQFPAAIQRALRRSHDGTARPFYPEHATTRSQDLEPGFFDAGQFYWGTRDAWLTERVIHLDARTIVLPEWRVVDIDTPEDWDRAERFYAAMNAAREP